MQLKQTDLSCVSLSFPQSLVLLTKLAHYIHSESLHMHTPHSLWMLLFTNADDGLMSEFWKSQTIMKKQ